MTAPTCPTCDQPCTDPHGVHATCPEPGTAAALEDALLARPGVMRAAWWSLCRCGARIAEREVVGLAERPDGRAWVCRTCLTTPDVPAPRPPADTTQEVHA